MRAVHAMRKDGVVMEFGIEIPMRTWSEPNARMHWAAKHKRTSTQRQIVDTWLRRSASKPCLPCLVRLTRIAPRMLDSDNLQGAFKATRDSIAAWIGVDDGPKSSITWEYAQEKGKAYAVRIEIVEGA